MSILRDLYYGKIRYDEKPIAADSEHERLSREVVDMERRFRAELSDEAKRQYDLYTKKVNARRNPLSKTRGGIITTGTRKRQ